MGFDKRLSFIFLALAMVYGLAISTSDAQEFYKGKTIRIVVATTPEGGFDAYSRMIARHMGKHIPGNPSFTLENMPGAAFLIGTNIFTARPSPMG